MYMTQKNIIIALLVLILLFMIFGYGGRHYYGGWGMMDWMYDRDEDIYEEMEENMSFDEDKETPTSADNAPPGSIHNLPVPEAVAAVKTKVATELGIGEGTVIVMSAYEQDWSDGCLGLGGPAESCIAVITPGFEVTVLAQGSERIFRTNVDGSIIREE